MPVTDILRTFTDTMSKHSPAILTGLGVVGFVTTVVMVGKASPKASEVHRSGCWERDDIETSGETAERKKELLKDSYLYESKAMAKLYLPATGVGVASVACFVMANKINVDRQAALMAAYSISTETLARYQGKVIEKIGDSEHAEILRETTKELVRENVPESFDADHMVVPDGGPVVRVYDNVTGRYFFSSKERIMEAESEINKRLLAETRVSLQEFYYALGLEERFNLGQCLGWDISSYKASDNILDIYFTPMLDDDKNPCLALNYHVCVFDRGV